MWPPCTAVHPARSPAPAGTRGREAAAKGASLGRGEQEESKSLFSI